MRAIVPKFELPEKWQVQGRIRAYGHAAWDVIPVVWPGGSDYPIGRLVRISTLPRSASQRSGN